FNSSLLFSLLHCNTSKNVFIVLPLRRSGETDCKDKFDFSIRQNFFSPPSLRSLAPFTPPPFAAPPPNGPFRQLRGKGKGLFRFCKYFLNLFFP
ncbi:MAG: hypothetical protein J1E79_07840, partial [Rikenella sp.]|nr:hypothetical protein [Rikenella sp.]